MAKKFPPGWYPTPDGYICLWDGKSWVGAKQPAAPAGGAIGWYLQVDGVYRWWCGDHWSPARAARDGSIDVAKQIGQDIIDVVYLGAGADRAIGRLYQRLAEYPPCRVEQINTYNSMVAAGTNLVALVSWDGPRLD